MHALFYVCMCANVCLYVFIDDKFVKLLLHTHIKNKPCISFDAHSVYVTCNTNFPPLLCLPFLNTYISASLQYLLSSEGQQSLPFFILYPFSFALLPTLLCCHKKQPPLRMQHIVFSYIFSFSYLSCKQTLFLKKLFRASRSAYWVCGMSECRAKSWVLQVIISNCKYIYMKTHMLNQNSKYFLSCLVLHTLLPLLWHATCNISIHTIKHHCFLCT